MGLDGSVPRCQFPQLQWGTEGLCGERFSELRACRQTGLGLHLKGPEHERRNRGAAPGPSRCAPSCQKACLPASVLLGRDVTPRSRAQRGPECHSPSTRLRCWDWVPAHTSPPCTLSPRCRHSSLEPRPGSSCPAHPAGDRVGRGGRLSCAPQGPGSAVAFPRAAAGSGSVGSGGRPHSM